jgi:thioredoxin 1
MHNLNNIALIKKEEYMGATVAVTDGTFNEIVLKSTTPVLVDFWATWCKPCLMVAPILEELTKDYTGKLTIAKLDVDQNQQTAQKYHVMSIPTMIIFKEGKPVVNIVGFKPKDKLKQELDAALG